MSLRSFLSALLGVFALPAVVGACALVSRPDTTVQVDGEEVLIVWDAENRKEHMIRHIGFRGDAQSFGFLVPTPAEPSVTEVLGDPFGRLYQLYRREPPRPRTRTRGVLRASGGGNSLGGVEVVAEHHVAGQTATVLRASDAGALDRWLAENDYPSGPALEAYVRPYVERGWFVTAFKYDKEQPRVESPTIALSFHTEAPFFPYAEPRGNRPARAFRLTILAPTPMRAHLSRTGASGARWSARVGYRDALSESDQAGILQQANVGAAGTLHMTTFDEPRSRRGRRDLYFAPDPEARDVRPRITTRIVPPRQPQGTSVLRALATGALGGPRVVDHVRGRVELLEVAGDGGTYDPAIVQRMVRRRLRAVQRCFERELRVNPEVQGELTVKFSLLERGSVSHARVEANSTGNAGVAACVLGTVRRFRFNPGPEDGAVEFTLRFRFRPLP